MNDYTMTLHELSELVVKLQRENAALRGELAVVRRELAGMREQLLDSQIPPQNTAIVFERAVKFLIGEADRMRNFYRNTDASMED